MKRAREIIGQVNLLELLRGDSGGPFRYVPPVAPQTKENIISCTPKWLLLAGGWWCYNNVIIVIMWSEATVSLVRPKRTRTDVHVVKRRITHTHLNIIEKGIPTESSVSFPGPL